MLIIDIVWFSRKFEKKKLVKLVPLYHYNLTTV